MTTKLSSNDAALARDAAGRVVEVHQRLVDFLAHGQTLLEIDQFVARTLESLKSTSAFRGYRIPRLPAFPSYACLSLNSCVVHGTATYTTAKLKHGDVLKIDIGVVHKGFIGDAAWTYVFGEPTDEVRRLCDSGKKSLHEGAKTLHPANTYMEWARTVQSIAEGDYGFHLVRGLGGHGYGRKLHTRPYISNTVPTYPGEWPDAFSRCEPGSLVAVEPMIAVGTPETVQASGQWPVFTADGSQCVHYEHDVLITEDGPEVLTAALEDLPDVITRGA
ncbi:MAG: type I methionyl aminopeptidase [Phycisphaerales bacterium]